MKVKGPRGLYIDPLLSESQLGEVTIDLRLGTDFLVSVVTRRPSIDSAQRPEQSRGIASYFRSTRRELGDKFVLYPSQVVLGTTLEYVGLPDDVYADIISRSSFSRLGIHHNTMIQPGFRGCIPLELFNHGNNPIELVVGGRLVQARLMEMTSSSRYQSATENRKYFGNVRPVISKAQHDPDLDTLTKLRES
ncbi:dCTP deaminase [Mesorhizobium sp. M0904]|uniref:dCTP deaminase n=1 Tax=Mesorhizobium sp. M0904 TaxID=2957022 RepID=UPI00333551CD